METFVLRVWRAADDLPGVDVAAALHGTVEHVSTGRAEAFCVEDELVEFVRARLRNDGEGQADR